jgi:outer membrane protein
MPESSKLDHMGGEMEIRKTAIIAAMGITLVMLGSTVGFCADVAKIGTVSFQKILSNSSAGKAAQEQITQEGQRMEADLKQKGEEIKTLEQKLKQNADVMSKEGRDEKSWELDRKINDIKALKKKYDHDIQELQMRLVNKMRKDLLQIIKDYGKKEGYLLIVEDISVVYAPQTLDITDQVIQIYNEQHAKQGKKS